MAMPLVAQQLVPSALLLFDGLKRAYAARNEDESSEEGDSDEEGIDSELLDSDEDEIDDEGQAYLESLQVIFQLGLNMGGCLCCLYPAKW